MLWAPPTKAPRQFNFLKRVLNILHLLTALFLPRYNGKEHPAKTPIKVAQGGARPATKGNLWISWLPRGDVPPRSSLGNPEPRPQQPLLYRSPSGPRKGKLFTAMLQVSAETAHDLTNSRRNQDRGRDRRLAGGGSSCSSCSEGQPIFSRCSGMTNTSRFLGASPPPPPGLAH